MKRLLIASAFMLLAIAGRAQTFYEVNFVTPEDSDEYLGLLIYYSDDSCTLRIIDKEMLENGKVAESRYAMVTADKENADDVGIMAFAPEVDGFPVFMWVWQKDDGSDICEKPFVYFNPDGSDAVETEYFVEMSLKDMDEEYVAQFYAPEDPEYKLLLSGINTVKKNDVEVPDTPKKEDPKKEEPVQPVVQETPVFHLLMVANTSVSDIGTACARDLSNIKNEFSAISRVLGMKYDEHIVSGDDFSKENVAKAVNDLKAGPNDVLMFVYSGHGFRFDDQTDYYPNMDLCTTSYDDPRQNYASMTDVYNAVVAKGARLNIVLSDCCNTMLGANTPMVNTNSLFSRSNSNFDINRIRSLFLGSEGNVWATAASPGESSWCAVSGGFFLLSFLENLRKQISPLESAAPTWEALIENTVNAAHKKSTSNAACKAQNGIQQVHTKSVHL